MTIEWDMEEAKNHRFSESAQADHYVFVDRRFKEDYDYVATDEAKKLIKEYKTDDQ